MRDAGATGRASETVIETIEQLEALYGDPVPTAITKEVDRLVPLHRRFIEMSPFVVLVDERCGWSRLFATR